jgi:hypothetical protein
MNNEIPKWTLILLAPPVKALWTAYCFCYFRGMILGHYLRGDITFTKLVYILLPAGMRPRNFSYF